MSRTVTCFALCALLLAFSFSVQGQQQAKKISQIGFVTPCTPSPNLAAFRQALRDLGYIEGKNIQFESRYAKGKLERLPGLVADLVQHKVDVLIVGTLIAARAAKEVTKTIPIVIVLSVDQSQRA